MPLRATGLHADELPVVMGGRHILGPPVVGEAATSLGHRSWGAAVSVAVVVPIAVSARSTKASGRCWCWMRPARDGVGGTRGGAVAVLVRSIASSNRGEGYLRFRFRFRFSARETEPKKNRAMSALRASSKKSGVSFLTKVDDQLEKQQAEQSLISFLTSKQHRDRGATMTCSGCMERQNETEALVVAHPERTAKLEVQRCCIQQRQNSGSCRLEEIKTK
jgi:hypothetical protein